MREILFRGKSLIDNEWVIGAGVYKSEGYTWIITDDATKAENRGTGSDAIIPETVGQYTGLTDKNGKRIFEGDIVKGAWGTVFVVFYDECYLQFRAKKADSYAREIDYYGFSHEIEVIGNIHDNPELLKESEDAE